MTVQRFTAEQLDKVLDTPATWCDRVIAQTNAEGARLTFAEGGSSRLVVRARVMLSPTQMAELRELLDNAIDEQHRRAEEQRNVTKQ